MAVSRSLLAAAAKAQRGEEFWGRQRHSDKDWWEPSSPRSAAGLGQDWRRLGSPLGDLRDLEKRCCHCRVSPGLKFQCHQALALVKPRHLSL